MKKIYLMIVSVLGIGIVLSSCHKTDVKVNSELTPEVFPQTPEQYTAATGAVYIALRNDYAGSYFFSQSQTTDENLLAIFNSDWIDGNRYKELHRHTWTKDNSGVNAIWYFLTNMIGVANQTISVFKNAPAGSAKNTSIAELKTMRAFAYFMMVDNFGNVPLDTLYGTKELQPTTPRTKVFEFVESELKAAIPFLKSDVNGATYGLPTKYLAYSILAKMYLNAAVYTGTARYDDCIAACDQIINSKNYSIETMANYLQMFYPTNGPGIKEFIFAVPYDASVGGNLIFARYNLNRNLGIRYSYSGSTAGGFTNPVMNQSSGNGLVNNRPSGPSMTTSEYYAYFDDPNDIRNKQWLTGQQFWPDGSPILVSTTKQGYDQFFTGSSDEAKATVVYPLVLTPLPFKPRTGTNSDYDLGRDEIAWNTGYRNNKFLPDYTNTINRNQNNDMPVFRYSDIILMKAEAILRGGAPTLGATALSLVNQVKTNRTTSPALTTINLEGIYSERVREFAFEGWHRNDMIRFGKFENTYGLGKTNAETYRRLFPIPTSGLQTNTKLVQNPGY